VETRIDEQGSTYTIKDQLERRKMGKHFEVNDRGNSALCDPAVAGCTVLEGMLPFLGSAIEFAPIIDHLWRHYNSYSELKVLVFLSISVHLT
jgi:hypothetical protein